MELSDKKHWLLTIKIVVQMNKYVFVSIITICAIVFLFLFSEGISAFYPTHDIASGILIKYGLAINICCVFALLSSWLFTKTRIRIVVCVGIAIVQIMYWHPGDSSILFRLLSSIAILTFYYVSLIAIGRS